MARVLRQILLLLVAFPVVSGTTWEAARAAQFTAATVAAGAPCDMAMTASPSDDTKPMAPCKGMTPDCMKQICCVTATALPAHFLTLASTVWYGAIDYWVSTAELAGLDRQPEPLPPRTT
jgi:hypothetical protein